MNHLDSDIFSSLTSAGRVYSAMDPWARRPPWWNWRPVPLNREVPWPHGSHADWSYQKMFFFSATDIGHMAYECMSNDCMTDFFIGIHNSDGDERPTDVGVYSWFMLIYNLWCWWTTGDELTGDLIVNVLRGIWYGIGGVFKVTDFFCSGMQLTIKIIWNLWYIGHSMGMDQLWSTPPPNTFGGMNLHKSQQSFGARRYQALHWENHMAGGHTLWETYKKRLNMAIYSGFTHEDGDFP